MAEHSLVGICGTLGEAEAAVRSLDAAGFPIGNVSIVAKNLVDDRHVHGYVTSCDVAKASAGAGAWMGGIFGLLAGAAFLWIPGVGPLVIVGSLAAAALGGVEGAVTGAAFTGVLGWLFSLGISREKILVYEEAVKAGKYLVISRGTADEVAKAKRALAGSMAILDPHVPVGAI